MTLTDESPMPWGRNKGTRMIDVPASDLLYYYESNKCSADVREYVEDNLDVLQEEVKRDMRQKEASR
jgi:uncharacterized protein (DUF3820 family)